VLRRLRRKIHHPYVRLADDGEAMNAVLGIRHFLDSAVRVAGAINGLRFSGETILWQIRTVGLDDDFRHRLGSVLRDAE